MKLVILLRICLNNEATQAHYTTPLHKKYNSTYKATYFLKYASLHMYTQTIIFQTKTKNLNILEVYLWHPLRKRKLSSRRVTSFAAQEQIDQFLSVSFRLLDRDFLLGDIHQKLLLRQSPTTNLLFLKKYYQLRKTIS